MDETRTLCSRCGSFSVVLNMEPPRATHQDKSICYIRPRRPTVRDLQRGGVRPILADNADLRNARELYHVHLRAAARQPNRPLEGPIELAVLWCFQSEAIACHISKPDLDNLTKGLQDSLVDAGYIARDEQVCGSLLYKAVAPVPLIAVSARVVPPGYAAAILDGFIARDGQLTAAHIR